MRQACAKIDPTVRYSGKLRGRGALLECNAAGDMVHVMDGGVNFADKEEMADFPGLFGVVSKVVMQPYDTSYPSVVIAPAALEINVTSLLVPFGTHLHRVAVQGFDTGPVVWLGVILELVFCAVCVIIQMFMCRPRKVKED